MMICADCEIECTASWVDMGIGPSEFWGTKGIDKRMEFRSDCCEGEVLDESGCNVELPEDGPDPDDELQRRRDMVTDKMLDKGARLIQEGLEILREQQEVRQKMEDGCDP